VIPAVVVGGCALLLARPALFGLGPPALVVAVLFTGLLLLALAAPVPRAVGSGSSRVMLVLGAGVAAFAIGRVIAGGHAPAFTWGFVALNTLAAIAEEALFRRVLYAALVPVGAVFAIVGGAVLFALVHITIYGMWVLPLDIAAGVLFGWQRWATDRWSVPAATHAAANVFVVI
jgi:membrane protease YdiL (CAAX protease family)